MVTRLQVETIGKEENKPFTSGRNAGKPRLVSTLVLRDMDNPQFVRLDVQPAEAAMLKPGMAVYVQVNGIRTYSGLGTMLSGRLVGCPSWAKP